MERASKRKLAILSICGAYGVPRERAAARDTWVPTVNGENFGELGARTIETRNIHLGEYKGEKTGRLLKTRAERGGARGIYRRDFSRYELPAG